MDPVSGKSFGEMKLKFVSAETVIEMLEAFKDLERCLDDSDLGFMYWIVANKLNEEGYEDTQKVVDFANKALRIMIRNGDSSETMPIVGTLQILATTCSKLNRFNDSLKYLNWGVRMLEKLEGDSSQDTNMVLSNLHNLNLQLYSLKQSMGAGEDCISYMLKNLDITEKLSGKISKELADANWEVSNLYFVETKYQEARPFCLKALDIYMKCPGDNSEKIVQCNNQLGVLYNLIEENERDLEHNQVLQEISNKLDCTSLSPLPEIEAADMLNQLGKSEEAIQALRDIVPRAEKHGRVWISAFVHMAEAFLKLEKIEDAKECSEIVCGILDKKKHSTLDDAIGFTCIADVYKKMNEFETALSLLRKGLAIIQGEKTFPAPSFNPLVEKASKNLVPLLLLTGRVEEAIPYLEGEVNKAKVSFGPKHVEVGQAYRTLGSAYFNAKKLQLSAQAFSNAKDILDGSLGPHHCDSIMLCKSLYTAHRAMGSYSIAIRFLEETMKRLEALGASAQGEWDQAATFMSELKEMVSNDVSAQESQPANSLETTNVVNQQNGDEIIE